VTRKRTLALLCCVGLGALALISAGQAPAAYPGANGKLVFTSVQDNQTRHIFVTARGGAQDLTGAGSSAAEAQPEFSPNGKKIVFTRAAHGLPNTEIFVMSANGKHRKQLTDTPTGNSDPTWSPSGKQIAFVSARARGEVPDVYVMNADGSHVKRITHNPAAESDLAWSPTGKRIAFVSVPAGGGDRDIYSMTPSGKKVRNLTNDPTSYDLQPDWSPNGKQIVFQGAHHATGSVGADLWIMNANGSGVHELDHENNGYSDGGYPAWSPDGSTIAFGANNGSGYYHVWSVPAGGGQNSEVVTNDQSGNPLDQELDWQPRP
jgi:TolB protein